MPLLSMSEEKIDAEGVETSVSLRAAARKQAEAATPCHAGLRLISLIRSHSLSRSIIGLSALTILLQPACGIRPEIKTVPGEVVVRAYRPLTSPDAKGKASIDGTLFFEAQSLVPDAPEPTKRVGSAVRTKHTLYLLRGPKDIPAEKLLEAARALPGVFQAEPNYIGTVAYTPSDPQYDETSDHFARIGLEAAWEKQQGSDPSVVVAVIDSGVDPLHVDLDEALHPDSWNFVDGNDNVFDDLAHGTRVAGIIGAEGNNGEGIAGIAFGCQILSLDVADSLGLITTARVIAALEYATSVGTQVINLSLTFRGYSHMLEEACKDASDHAVVVASSGNENQSETPAYPASFDSVIGVGATMLESDDRALFSNYNGLEDSLVDLVAPGVNIYTTIPGSMYEGVYTSGTSFSAPMVTGVAALLQTSYPSQSAPAIANHLKSTATPLPDWAGHGLLSAADALRKMMEPSLSVASVEVDDSVGWDAGNDADGNWDAGETVRLVIYLTNEGGDADGLTGVLSTSDPDISLTDSSTAWGTVAGDETKPATDPIDSALVSASADAHDALFDLAVSAQYSFVTGVQQYTAVLPFKVNIDNKFTPSTIIAADTTWTVDKTYVIEENTVVMPSATLTIEPGTTLRFGKQGGMEIRGGIISQGTPDGRITFTSESGMPGGDFGPELVFPLAHNGNLNLSDVDNDGLPELICGGAVYTWDGSQLRLDGSITVEEFRFARDLHPDGTNGRWSETTFVGDADNDGYNDIVTPAGIRRWNGTDFDPEVQHSVVSESSSIAIGDADNDGDDEIVTASRSDGISVLRWTGTASDPEVLYSVGGKFTSVAIGDADNDGDNDIVAAHTSSDVSLLRWNGTHFDPVGLRVDDGATVFSVAIGDADNDGDNDIMSGNFNCNTCSYLALFRWNGIDFDSAARFGTGVDVEQVLLVIGDVDNDNDNDVVSGHVWNLRDVSLFLWNQTQAVHRAYDGVMLHSSALRAEFSHCSYRFAPVLDESSVASFKYCLFDRTGGEYSLSSMAGTNPLMRCQVTGNDGGDGIRAGAKDLIDCFAEENAGTGLQGGTLSGCDARHNGGDGMSGTFAEECIAINNGGTGISVSGDIDECLASFNRIGMSGANVTNCTAVDNIDKGIQANGNSTKNLAENNEGVGIIGNDFTDCVVVENGSGLSLSGTALRTYVAQNTGDGVTGGILQSSSVLNHSGDGVTEAQSVQNSWIVGNAGIGIQGRSGPPYTTITESRISGNARSGLQSLGPMAESIVLDNGGPAGFDYEETRRSTELVETDLSGNYWGPENTAFMNDNPWGTYADVPRIHDFVDDTNLTLARYEDHLQSDPGVGPDTTAPAFLLSVTPNLANGVNVGVATFTLIFSEPMDQTVPPSVTFDSEYPFAAHVVNSNGWVSDTSWQGTFAFGIDTGDGLNTVRVANARAADGFVIPDDTAHTFVIDVWFGTGGVINNGVALPLGPDTMFLHWDPSLDTTIVGYQIVRARRSVGPYALIADLGPSAYEYTDTGLEADTTYYYQVYEYDVRLNSHQLTSPFFEKTDPPYTPTPTDTPTITHIPTETPTATQTMTHAPTATHSATFVPPLTYTQTVTATRTPTPTPSPTHSVKSTPTRTFTPSPMLDLDSSPDSLIDARDLLLFMDSIRSGHSERTVLFLLSERWKEDVGE